MGVVSSSHVNNGMEEIVDKLEKETDVQLSLVNSGDIVWWHRSLLVYEHYGELFRGTISRSLLQCRAGSLTKTPRNSGRTVVLFLTALSRFWYLASWQFIMLFTFENFFALGFVPSCGGIDATGRCLTHLANRAPLPGSYSRPSVTWSMVRINGRMFRWWLPRTCEQHVRERNGIDGLDYLNTNSISQTVKSCMICEIFITLSVFWKKICFLSIILIYLSKKLKTRGSFNGFILWRTHPAGAYNKWIFWKNLDMRDLNQIPLAW